MKKEQSRLLSILSVALGMGSGLLALVLMTWALEKPLLGPHSFRQTQTALSTAYMAENPRMFFDYITPVLGKPWPIPQEVPIFQWVVARFHNLTKASLDESGQLISAFFWFLCLVPIAQLGRTLNFPLEARWLMAAVCLATPLYLFWGRAFLIETTGTFLALSMVVCACRAVAERRLAWIVGTLILGVLAALGKVTTWAVAAGVAILLVVFGRGWPKRDSLSWLGGALLAIVVPFGAAKLWLKWADSVKACNPFARELIISSSPNQAAWNYGTLEQKLSPDVWAHIFRHIQEGLLVAPAWLGILLVAGILLAGAIASPRRIALVGIFLAGFAAGPIIFTNLYFEHSYYWCANGIWLLMAVGTGLTGLWEEGGFRQRITALVLSALLVLGGFAAWFQRYLPILQSLPSRQQLEQSWIKPVQALVPRERTLLIVGNDWNPNSLYYAGRKGIAFPIFASIPFPGPQLAESLALLSPEESLGAVVVNPRTLEAHPQIFEAFFRNHGFSSQGIPTAFGILFPALDLKYGALPGS